ncbi:OmpA family protein [Novosphingobium bradum]|uniref:OmpA family protein n=1 Tax=Novosphingobium bradum TaxID=1737444 RepID=A0ABV7IUH1_9SPHN
MIRQSRPVLFASALACAAALSGASGANAQDQRVSEDAVRCFVQTCAAPPAAGTPADTGATGTGTQPTTDDECLASGVCAVGASKQFSLARMGKGGGARPAAAGLAPAAPRQGASAQRLAVPTARRAHAPSATRQSLDMRLSFELNSAELTPAAREQANVFAKVLRESPAAGRFVIEGHTDSIGSAASNLQLSRRRAESVVAWLAGQGVSRDRLSAVGYGFRHPRDGLAASDPRNRRVEIVRTIN